VYLSYRQAKQKLHLKDTQLLLYVKAGFLKPYLCLRNVGFELVDSAQDKAELLLGDVFTKPLTDEEEKYFMSWTDDFEAEVDETWLFKDQDCDLSTLHLESKPNKSKLEQRVIIIKKAITALNYIAQSVEDKGEVQKWCLKYHADLFLAQDKSNTNYKFKRAWTHGNKEGLWAIKPEKNKSN